MSKVHLYAAMTEPVIREFQHFADLEIITDTARMHGSDAVWREITGKICGRGLIWDDFMNYWKPLQHAPIQSEGITYFGVKFIMVNFDRYANFTYLNVEGNTLRMILMEAHHGTLETWQKKCEKRTKRVQDFLDHVRMGQFSRNDYRELMGHERLTGPHMNEVFTADAMRELMKGIEVFPSWKKKTQNEIA
jgi:hypothetical protein